MQNVEQSENSNIDKVNVQLDVVKSSTPHSSSSSPAKSETETYSEAPAKYMTDSSESEDDSVSEAEIEDEGAVTESSKFLLSHNDPERAIDPEMQARIEALLETAGIGKLSNEGKHLADPEALRRLTSSVSYALDEAAAALTRMRSDQPPQHHRHHQEKPTQCAPTSTSNTAVPTTAPEGAPSLAEACSDGDVGTVRKLLTEGRSVHETTEEGESLLSLACSAGYYELAQVLLAMHANVEDRGIKGDCTPLMEAASVGHVEIVRLLVAHGADVNAVSGTGNTPLMYACAGGHEDCVKALIESGANVEDHNENGHTPLMEAASAGQVGVAKILLEHGAGINTHSNEFKESALTLACYKGHLDMVRFLLAAGADREHKTDEMHTALMEASMDGHVEVARLLLDSGAQVNMPTDSFESPLTLAACGGHVELAMLLLERGANIEEVNDEGYTPLMEAAREGHEEMVALLLGQGASINAQTEETQETALTLACCGGFMEVADFLIKAGADIELGASTPLMEASQEGHLELVRYLLANGADVRAVTATGDCALSYACENGHTDVAQVLLRGGAALEHESEGGRTPLMKAARASHLCTVQFLVAQGADVNRTTRSGDHTPLSLACAGGHLEVVKFLLACDADPFAKLKDNSSTVIEAARGGHTAVVQLLLDYPYSLTMPRPPPHPHPHAAPTHNGLVAHANNNAAPPAIATPAPTTANNNNTAATTPAPTNNDFAISYAKGLQFNSNKHKCARKLRTIANDHRLPPPPDIANEQKPDLLAVAQTNNKLLPETERNLELPENPGPPSLATSALQALDLQFNSQGLTTQQPEPPHLPPLFPVQQNTANATQQQLQQHQLKTQHQCIELAEQYVQQNQECGASPCGDSRELAAVLAYLQREVPSLVALPPDELRSLVVQVMQQKSHEILYPKCPEGANSTPGAGDAAAAPSDPNTRQLLDAAEFAMAADWARQRPRPGEAISEQRAENPSEPRLQQTYEEYRKSGLSCSGKHETPLVKKKAKARATARTNNRPTQTGAALDVDAETESNHDTALTLACAGGHEELVQLLLARGAHMEHRDKKGFTPLILAATAGHVDIVELLLDIGADIEAQSERTKDTPLSLACSGGRYEVVELLLNRGANKEHRNVSDYTPLSLAASGGFVNIIRMLLHHQAEINSRTGSKLGISPLMLAAMNGHTAAVRLLLDCGSDINAQIETNRNTALTLACFQGRHEVVSLLLERRANAEHRAKTGLTPLMEAASGGYVEVGRVLLDKGADVNAPPVPSSRDTALTIAADKGHVKFVELLLKRGAAVEVKNKKGNSPLWLAANGGHLMVVELLYAADADIESQDNRKVSCLMAAFRKGHTKVVKWMVDIVRQFPSDQEMTRFVCTINDKELLEKCQECMRLIRAAKETQAARANQNATILLEELESERCREENRRLAAARRREKKKKKKMEKKEERRKQTSVEKQSEECSEAGELEEEPVAKEDDSGIDANSQGSCSSSDVKGPPPNPSTKTKKKKDKSPPSPTAKKQPDKPKPKPEVKPEKEAVKSEKKVEKENVAPVEPVRPATPKKETEKKVTQAKEKKIEESNKCITVQNLYKYTNNRKCQVFESSRLSGDRDDNDKKSTQYQWEAEPKSTSPKSAPASARREDGWKEVVRKSSVQAISTVEPGCKRVSVTSHAISRVIGRAGSNINAIRSATGAHIEVDKQTKGQADRIITIKGSAEATKQAANLIAAMIRDPDADIALLLPRKPTTTPQPIAVKTVKATPKQVAPVVGVCVRPSSATTVARKPQPIAIARPTQPTSIRPQPPAAPIEKRMSSPVSSKSGSYTAVVGARAHTFAAKLTNTTTPEKIKTCTSTQMPIVASAITSSPNKQPMREVSNETTYKVEDDTKRSNSHLQLSPESSVGTWNANEEIQTNTSTALHINTQTVSTSGTQEYSLFKDLSSVAAGVWAVEHNPELPPPQRVDLSKAPGYRGGCSPCSRTSSHGSTPPPQNNHYNDTLHAIGSTVNAMDLSGLSRNGPIYQDPSRNGHNLGMVSMSSAVGMSSSSLGLGYMGVSVESRLNPRAPDFSHHKPTTQLSYASGSNNANLSNLLMSYQQQQPTHKPMPVHPYQSLLERGVGAECEERKPRPIGTERAWKLTANEEWSHAHSHVDHERYQQQQNVQLGNVTGVEGFSGTGATAAALSLMQALPLQYLPQNHDHHHWDNHQHDKQQTWNKWTH